MLKKRGLPLPEETLIGIDEGYATGIFHIPSDAPSDWKSVFTFGGLPPTSARGALMWPIEGNRWIVSFAERHGDTPPGDVDGFMAFARTLRTPTIYNAVKNARLDGESRAMVSGITSCAILNGWQSFRAGSFQSATPFAGSIPSTGRA